MCLPFGTHPFFQKVIKKLFGLKSSNYFRLEGVTSCSFAFLKLLSAFFLKFHALFISSTNTIIYSFLLVWVTFFHWHIIMHIIEVVFHQWLSCLSSLYYKYIILMSILTKLGKKHQNWRPKYFRSKANV